MNIPKTSICNDHERRIGGFVFRPDPHDRKEKVKVPVVTRRDSAVFTRLLRQITERGARRRVVERALEMFHVDHLPRWFPAYKRCLEAAFAGTY